MEFLHTRFVGGPNNWVLVTVDAQCNVLLLDDASFRAYQRGEAFRYYGGWAARSPVRLPVPYHGHWHVVVDTGGSYGTVHVAVRVLDRAQQVLF